jgi:hypothetical protein
MPQLSDRSMALRHLNLTAYYDPAGSSRETPFALARGRSGIHQNPSSREKAAVSEASGEWARLVAL